jgi:hypothetical protein
VLTWPLPALEAEIARAILASATADARELARQEEPTPPSGTDLRAEATRAVFARLMDARRAQEEAEQEAALDALFKAQP